MKSERKKERKLILASLFVSSLLYANETTKLDEITVSANKMEENIKDVPQSISVISQEDIEQKGIKNISDIVKEVPNMNMNTVNGNKTSFRGVNTSLFTNNNPVVIYVDGVPYYDVFDYNPSLADVEQVEVLRGPQGTLYGKDAIGAVINITTKNPKNEWSGTLGTEYGNYNTLNTKLNTSGALIDNKLYAGINGSFDHTDGWVENHHAGMDKHANKRNDRKTSGFLLYKPTDNLTARLTVANNYDKKYFMSGIAEKDTSKSPNNYKRKDAKNADFEMPSLQSTKVNSQALNIAYELEKVKFDSTTTHKKVDYKGDYDGDFISGNSNDDLTQFAYIDIDTYTQEFKISSKNQDIKWVTGLYFDKEERKQGPYGGDQYYYGGVYHANADSITDSKTYAVFGQTMIPLGESFELTLGGRYQKIKKEMNADVENILSGAGMFDFNNTFKYDDEKSWNTFLPKAALSYKINDNLTTYVSISKGYMPGGFNFFPSNNISQDNSFKPQQSINYEVGAKYIGDEFALNANIFRMDIKDIHIYKTDGLLFATDNAKKAHTQGVELDGTYFLTDNLSISGAVGLIQAKYDDYDAGTKKYDGERIENTPKYTASLGVSYLANSGVYGRVDLNAIGKTSFFNSAESSVVEVDGAITANAKVGYKLKDWDIYAYIKNITDEEYITFYMAKSGLGMAEFNEPRRFGIGAIYKF
ncbi:TonB-dependent receptor [Arcobacter lanthieri]|nr:TonB-dependent receptor [Aliarcobacter lanthieri]